jgi:hypothetical protein
MLNTTEMSRNELYELVWSKTLNAVAAEYQISVPVLRQLCMDQTVPMPGFGYKVTSDYERRIPLPDRSDESGFKWSAALAKALNALHFPGETAFSFQIPSKLSNPDVLVVAVKNTIKQDQQLYGMEICSVAVLVNLLSGHQKKSRPRPSDNGYTFEGIPKPRLWDRQPG